MSDVFALTNSEQKFVNDTKRSVALKAIWISIGALFLLVGVYLTVLNSFVFSHIDYVFARGKISVVLKESEFSQPKTDMEHLQQVLVREAYGRLIPTLFSFLGNCALVWGVSLVLFIRIQSKWIAIFKKLDGQSHFNTSR